MIIDRITKVHGVDSRTSIIGGYIDVKEEDQDRAYATYGTALLHLRNASFAGHPVIYVTKVADERGQGVPHMGHSAMCQECSGPAAFRFFEFECLIEGVPHWEDVFGTYKNLAWGKAQFELCILHVCKEGSLEMKRA